LLQKIADQIAEEKLNEINEKIAKIDSLNKITTVNKNGHKKHIRRISPSAFKKEKEDLRSTRGVIMKKSQRDRLVDLYELLELESNAKCRSKLKGTRAPCDNRDAVLRIDLEGYYKNTPGNKVTKRKFTSVEKLRCKAQDKSLYLKDDKVLREKSEEVNKEHKMTWEMLRSFKFIDVCQDLTDAKFDPLELIKNTEEDENIMRRIRLGRVKLSPIQSSSEEAFREVNASSILKSSNEENSQSPANPNDKLILNEIKAPIKLKQHNEFHKN